MENENEGREIEGVDAENERLDSENEGLENYVLTPHQKGYFLQNTNTINYNYGISNRRSMGWSNLIVGFYAIHNVAKDYVNVLNDIVTFVEPTRPTNIITNDIILIQ